MTTPIVIALLIVALIVLETSRQLDRRARRNKPPEPPGVQFPLRPSNSFTQVMTRFALGLAFAGCYLGLLFHFLARDTLALAIALPSLILPLPATWAFRRMHTGVVELRADRLLIGTRANTQSYPWRDIADVSVATWGEASAVDRLFVNAMGVGFEDRFVQLRLRRSVRIGFGVFYSEFGTDVPGIPTTLKTIRIFARDPDALVERARPYVAAGGALLAAGLAR